MSTAVSQNPRPPRSPRPPSDYSQLLKSVQQAGLMKRRYLYYSIKISLMVLAVAAIVAGFIALGDSWLTLLIAGALGVGLAQRGFLGHDAAQGQIFVSGKANHRATLVP